jgi:hypothetical protein
MPRKIQSKKLLILVLKSWDSASKGPRNGSNGTVDKPVTRQVTFQLYKILKRSRAGNPSSLLQTPEAPILEHWVETTPFCWEKYLEKCNAKPAPHKLFQSAFPLGKLLHDGSILKKNF